MLWLVREVTEIKRGEQIKLAGTDVATTRGTSGPCREIGTTLGARRVIVWKIKSRKGWRHLKAPNG